MLSAIRSTGSPSLSADASSLLSRLNRRGPRPDEYRRLSSLIQGLVGPTTDRLSLVRREAIQAALGAELRTPDTLLGHCSSKPRGYAGDFEIIDKIYRHHVSDDECAGNWDRYFHSLAAPRAVRNRKDYAKEMLRDLVQRAQHPVRVLNLASGPARDLAEFFDESPELAEFVHVDCVDMDRAAIEHAQSLLGPHLGRVRFMEANVFRFRPRDRYDLVWSAGLFDYFEDPVFVRILRRFVDCVRPTGELIVGNFHPRNPSLPLMLVQDWILHHRTEERLTSLAREAGVEGLVTVDQEPEGVNLFLRMRP